MMFDKRLSYHAANSYSHAYNLHCVRHAECTATRDNGVPLDESVRQNIERTIELLQGILKTDDKLKERADA